jgi:nitrile hydratase accessory protein
MTGSLKRELDDLGGAAAIPRQNGELVFDAPWQSRAFGMAVGLHEQGVFTWEEFRDRLIAEIAAWESEHREEAFQYWACWLRAFERLVVEKGFCADEALAARVAELAERPAGHDHEVR